MPQVDTKKRIGILRGGNGEYYASSLQKGGEIISFIFENLSEKYKTLDILIDNDYIWHINGIPINPGDLVHRVDMVWNTTHPSFSNILESLSIPNIGFGSFAFALQNDKNLLRDHMKQITLAMPMSVLLPAHHKGADEPRDKYAVKKAREIFEKFGSPWDVKFFEPDPSIDAYWAKSVKNELPDSQNEIEIRANTFLELVNAIFDGVKQEKNILVQEFIVGKIATTHSVPTFRGDKIYTFPLDSASGNFSRDEKEKFANLAKDLHKHIGAMNYLKSDFLLTPRGKVYLLQIDMMPDLKPDSHLSQVVETVGAKLSDIVEHVLERV